MFGRYKNKKTDFSSNSLPTTRRKQFLSFLKNEKLTLLKIGLTLFLFLLPYLFVLFYQKYTFYFLNEKLIAGEINKVELYYSVAMSDLIINGVKIVALSVFAIGVSGILRIVKNLTWNEGVFFFDDFKKGIKANYKQTLLVSIVLGLFIYLTSVFKDFANYTGSIYLVLGYYLTLVLFFVIVLPILLFWLSQVACYEGTSSMFIANTFPLMLKKFYFTLLFCIVPAGFFFLINIFNLYIYFGILALLIVVFSPYYIIIFHLYSLSLFDQMINVDDKEYYKKGLF